MNEAQSKAVKLLALQEEEYFAFNDERALELQLKLSEIWGEDFSGVFPGDVSSEGSRESPALLAISAPSRVYLDRHEELPVLVASCQTGLRRWQVNYDPNTHVIAADLATGVVRTGLPFIKGKRELTPQPSMSGTPPDEINARAVANSVRKINVRKYIDLPWRPSQLALAVIVYDWVSNTIVVELVGEKDHQAALQSTPPFPREMAIELARKVRRAKEDPESLLSFEASADTPKLEGQGLALSVPDSVSGETSPVRIQGAVKVELPAGFIVEPPPDEEGAPTDDGGVTSGDAEPLDVPAAVLAATLMLAELDVRYPRQGLIQVPVYSETPLKPGDTVEACFSMDLRAVLEGDLPPSTYQVYFILGAHISGPYPMTIKAD
jgi:hypothetical protein